MSERYELLAIGGGDYLRYYPDSGHISNVIVDATDTVQAVFTVAIDPDAPPITRAEADAIAADWRGWYAHRAAQDTRDGKMQVHRIAMNRRRFFHRRAP